MNKRLSFLIFSILAATSLNTPAHAGKLCDEYRRRAPVLFAIYCQHDGGTAKPAGSASTFSDSFNINPASLPTDPSPYGIESISTFLHSGTSPGFPYLALIKGFHRFGTGLSTSGANTFYSNPIPQRLLGPSQLQTLDDPEPSKGSFSNLNFGTSFALVEQGWGPGVQLGFSARYNKITNTIGGGPAVLLTTDYFSVGAGLSHEQVSNLFSASNYYSFLLSTRISLVEIEYDYLTQNNQPQLEPIQILTANLGISKFLLVAAVRKLNYLSEGDVTQFHFAIQYLVSRHFSLGYLYNYIPGGNSLGLQVFL